VDVAEADWSGPRRALKRTQRFSYSKSLSHDDVARIWRALSSPRSRRLSIRADVERFEDAFLTWGETNEDYRGFAVSRYTTRSTSQELLQMALGSMWLVCVTINVMFCYVMLVFAQKPYKEHLMYRAKLAMAGVGGVMIAANSGIFFTTMIQIPLTFASQFVMFIVLGIGLDGVFLLTDTFDDEPKMSGGKLRDPKERVISAVTHAGPSVLIASATDILVRPFTTLC
jgi:predicted RND superfamily exporter protein